MNVTVDFNDETSVLTEKHHVLVEEVIVKTAEAEGLSGEVEVSVTIVDEKRIQEINREYRDKDQPTDVISFALNEQGEGELHLVEDLNMPNILGDIIISAAHIQSQAEEYGHSFERELGFLAVHGMLHLLGYDHMTEAEEKEMFSRQEDILAAYGLTR
ncbi:rRNA maturation RNase YbeY [Halalkalibacter akibai]|uniref:Endoribonuclease YbeY n=1 Tax=Halalkalibacter akibai (strain ATCC 43226 / DSM 21942 / CIP 109018 / JCM 9157 / 1139) TaxID=1236973 RepID=W4QPX6_HALA3|nr:rRNA maturation RNase YbeY [Halalkalibacter akibai]GAE33399.1 metal-dependent hydrolase [Halalkalibacter akibai JCM 9157]